MTERGADPHDADARDALSADDTALVQRIRVGDADAFAALVAAHADAAARVAWAVLRSRDAAKDIVQQMFAALWVERARFTPRRSIRSYLLSVTRNQAVSAVRHAVVEERYRTSAAAGASVPGREDADVTASTAAQIEARATLAVLLGVLPERRRRALELRYLEQRSFDEIGEAMGISAGATKVLVVRALGDLRIHIGTPDASDPDL